MSVGDIHNRQGRIESTIEKLKTSEYISKNNREIILDFKDFLYSQDLSKDRIARYLYNWYQLLEHVSWELNNPEKDDLIELVGKINQDEIRDKELSPYTKMEYKKSIRKLYTDYLESKKDNSFDGEQLCDFFSLTVNTNNTDPDRLPTPEVVESLVQNAPRIRDKAMIMTVWSSAGRIGEVLGLQWQDIKFGKDIAKVRFRDTKTGGRRTANELRDRIQFELQKRPKTTNEIQNSISAKRPTVENHCEHLQELGIVECVNLDNVNYWRLDKNDS